MIIGRNEDSINYFYDVPVKLIPEIDCVRVLSSYTTEIIQPVPKVILETYRLNSTSPGSYLLEASKQFNVSVSFSNDVLKNLSFGSRFQFAFRKKIIELTNTFI